MNYNSMIRICCALFLGLTINLNAQNDPSGSWMQYSKVEEAGFDQNKLALVDKQLSQMRTSSFMVVHQGNVILAYGDVNRRFMTHSIRKSFMSAMYGIYIQKGDVNLYKTLKELEIDDKLGLTEVEKNARVLDLITARSGIYHPAAYEPRNMKENRPERGSKRPGESFFYNNWDFNTLLPILEKEAGIAFFDEFVNQIASPLGMEDLRKQDMQLRIEPDQSEHPAYLFKMSARDMARFGQLYLNQGKWGDQQIVPKQWVNESTAIYSHQLPGFPDREGYGYLWWTDDTSFKQPTYYASGLGGHRIVVMPESDLVIVHQVNSYLGLYERGQNVDKLIQLVLDAQTGKVSNVPSFSPLEVKQSEVPDFSISEKDFASFVGDYNHPFFGEISISSENGRFYAKGKILGNFRLFPVSRNRFSVEDLPELPIVFAKADEKNPRGKAVTKENERRMPTEFVMYY